MFMNENNHYSNDKYRRFLMFSVIHVNIYSTLKLRFIMELAYTIPLSSVGSNLHPDI